MRIVGTLATKFAPPFSLILHYIFGGVFFQILSFLLLFQDNFFYREFHSLENAAIAHAFLVGFVMMIIFGALYQLIPVALEVPVFSFKIGYIQFYLLFLGLLLFIFALFIPSYFYLLKFGAVFMFVSIFMFILNFFLSIRKIEKKDLVFRFLITANIYLFIGILFGLVMALNFFYSFLQIDVKIIYTHILLTIFGFVFMVISGVSLVLFPIFSLSHKFSTKYITLSYYFVSIGVFGFLMTSFVFEQIKILFFIFIILAVISYLLQVVEIYRKRPRKKSDFAINTMFFSNILLFISLFFIFDKYLFGIILFLGYFGTLIHANLYKVIPFLTWFHKFSNLVGEREVPTLNQMTPFRLIKIHIILYILATIILLFSKFFNFNYLPLYQISALLFLISAFLFLYNVCYILRYDLKRR